MPDGFTYAGLWAGGEINGEGRATYANGDVYQGIFVNGTRQGSGTMTYAATDEQDARVVQGDWEDGRLVSSAGASGDETIPEAPVEAPADDG